MTDRVLVEHTLSAAVAHLPVQHTKEIVMTKEQRVTAASILCISETTVASWERAGWIKVDDEDEDMRLSAIVIERLLKRRVVLDNDAARNEEWKEGRSNAATRMCRALRRTKTFLGSWTFPDKLNDAARVNAASDVDEALQDEYAF